MPLTPRVVVIPGAPLLLPDIASGEHDEVTALRVACRAAFDRVAVREADVHVIGTPDLPWPEAASSETSGRVEPWRMPEVSELQGLGMPLRRRVGQVDGEGQSEASTSRIGTDAGSEGEDGRPTPVSLLVAAALLDDYEAIGERTFNVAYPGANGSESVRGVGGKTGTPEVILVVGEGAWVYGTDPMYGPEPAAEAWDESMAEWLASTDPMGPPTVDPADERLWGLTISPAVRVAWQLSAGSRMIRELHYRATPFGICYLVSTWVPEGSA